MKLPALALPLLIAAAVALPTVACKRLAERAAEKAEEKAIQKQTGGEVSINGQKGTMTVVTDAGEMMVGTTAKIPADFPKEVAVYPGANPVMSAKQAAGGGKEAWTVMLETKDSKDKVVDYYKANMSGFTVASTMDMGTSAVRIYESPKYQMSLMVGAESGGKTSISLSVTTK